jgi:hypothetical protein
MIGRGNPKYSANLFTTNLTRMERTPSSEARSRLLTSLGMTQPYILVFRKFQHSARQANAYIVRLLPSELLA